MPIANSSFARSAFVLQLISLVALSCLGGPAAHARGPGLLVGSHASRGYGVWDTPSRFFPGQYFEHKAQFYLKKKDYEEALRLFKLSAYWADKVSQYNVGIMYFSGIGVPVNKPLGVAWLGLAAESHDTLADRALQAAYAELSLEQRKTADEMFAQLHETYGDDVTLPRALARYQQDAKISLFGFGVTGPGTVTTFTGPGQGIEEDSYNFVYRMDAQRDALIAQIRGHVTVGEVRAIDMPETAKRSRSDTVLQEPAQDP